MCSMFLSLLVPIHWAMEKNAIVIEYPVAGGSEESDISSQGGAGIVWKLSEK